MAHVQVTLIKPSLRDWTRLLSFFQALRAKPPSQQGVYATTLCGRDVGLRRAQSSRFAESGYPRFNPSGIDV